MIRVYDPSALQCDRGELLPRGGGTPPTFLENVVHTRHTDPPDLLGWGDPPPWEGEQIILGLAGGPRPGRKIVVRVFLPYASDLGVILRVQPGRKNIWG